MRLKTSFGYFPVVYETRAAPELFFQRRKEWLTYHEQCHTPEHNQEWYCSLSRSDRAECNIFWNARRSSGAFRYPKQHFSRTSADR